MNGRIDNRQQSQGLNKDAVAETECAIFLIKSNADLVSDNAFD